MKFPALGLEKHATKGGPMIHILAILGHLFPTCIECLGDLGRNRMAIAYDDGAFPSRHFHRSRIPKGLD